MDVLEEQYTPYKTGDNIFGGKHFDRSSTAKLASSRNIFADDSVKTITGLHALGTQREDKFNQDNVKDADDVNQSPDFQPRQKKTTRKKPIV